MSFQGREEGNGNGSYGSATPRHRPLEVTIGERGLEGALRLFKRLILKDGILRELKHRAHYEKPGDRRRRKGREAVRRRRKQQRRALERGERID
ncbi:MAG TPA: 30S ribosomal protein S21 [Candidatus Acidoferrum sp.]|nr:30S ribosomal protein S21 [Candidatus Acidoferrum sp.]